MNRTGKKGIMRSAALSAILITNTLLAACGQTAAAPSGAYSPANTSARLYLPMETEEAPEGAEFVGREMRNGKECAVYELASGVFSFS